MDAGTIQSQKFPVTRMAMSLVGLGACAALAGWLALDLTAHSEHLPAMLGSGAVAVITAIMAMLPIGPMARRSEQGIIYGVQVSMVLRLALTLGGAAILAWLTPLTGRQVGVWTLGWYIVLLIAEVVMILAYLRSDREVVA